MHCCAALTSTASPSYYFIISLPISNILSLLIYFIFFLDLRRPEIRRSFANNIFDAGFFTDFDWTALAEHRMTSPFIPPQSHTAFMDSKFSKRSIGVPYSGDNTIFSDF